MQDDPSSTVELHLSASLIRLAAEEMGLDPDRAALEPQFCFRDPRCMRRVLGVTPAQIARNRS